MKFFQTLAEGGQTWAHRVRMVKQVLKMSLGYSLLISFIYLVCSFCIIDTALMQSIYYKVKADVSSCLALTNISVSASFWEKISQQKSSRKEKSVSINQLKQLITKKTPVFMMQGKQVLVKSIYIGSSLFAFMLLFFLIRGSSSKRKHHISGKQRRHSFFLRLQLILKRKASDLKIGPVPLVKDTETQHILVTGGTGSGKTNCFHHILGQIRDKRQKAIIIDTTGAFVEKYFNPDKDFLLNPFDKRGCSWHPWIECADFFDYDNLAESMIPQSHHDHENYWRTAARSLFSAVLQKLSDTKRTSELAHWLLCKPLDTLAEFVQDTKAAAHIDINSEKTAASVRSVAASFLGFLDYIKDTELPFSIKQWVQNDHQESWLFLHAKSSQRAALNPLVAGWFSIAVRSLLQLAPDFERRLWFVIDELPTLQKLKDFTSLVTESRKYGGCSLLALQSPSQLEEIYGRATTQTIIGNCATRIIFAEHDPEIAERISRSLGESEIKEYQEGISYGAHEIRDGVNLSLQKKKVPIVSPTEIQSLENNQAYIKLPGNVPIAKIHLKLL